MKPFTFFGVAAVLLGACAREDAARSPEAAHEEQAHDEEMRVTGAIPGLETEAAGPHALSIVVNSYGTIAPDAERTRNVSARFPGIVTRVAKSPGDHVTAGEPLAIVESNDSLQAYAVKSPIAGTVTARHVNTGETVESQTMFTVSDLTSLWAEIMVFPRDFARVRVGQPVRLRAAEGELSASAAVSHISPVGASGTQAVTVRMPVANADGRWRPGLNVAAAIVVAQRLAPLAVRASALQALDGERVVFVPEGAGFAARVVQTGERDDEYVEILSGLAAGERYVARDSFLVKAELGKESAGHEH
jgi:membrane fusion protein, heavy metal efflux system